MSTATMEATAEMSAVSFVHLQMMTGRNQVLNGWNVCSRWLHKDCIDYDIIIGSDDKESLLCRLI